MSIKSHTMTALLAILAILVAGTFTSILITEAGADPYDPTADTVTLDNGSYYLWLYTSREPSFEHRTLAINVLAYGDAGDIRRQLIEDGRGDWNETDEEEQDVAPAERSDIVNATSVEWENTGGARRYTNLAGLDGESLWISEDYQLDDGEYLGSRHHVRAYTTPNEDAEWTAIQAHHEHWDWFNTQHIVTSTDESQAYLEKEFIDQPGSPEISRMPVGGEGRDQFDRWLSVVDFRGQEFLSASFIIFVFLGGITRRFDEISSTLGERVPVKDSRAILLTIGIVALVMAVRLMGVWLEGLLDIPPKMIAVGLYPLIFAGFPIAMYLLAQPLHRTSAFIGGSFGFLAAVLVDYTYLGVTHIPLDILVHRGGIAVALGMIAIGSLRSDGRNSDYIHHLRMGVLLWLVATLFPLMRHPPFPV